MLVNYIDHPIIPLGQRAFPLLDGVQMRTTTGAAVLALNDGSRVNLLPASGGGRGTWGR
jgi:hypothetical protein